MLHEECNSENGGVPGEQISDKAPKKRKRKLLKLNKENEDPVKKKEKDVKQQRGKTTCIEDKEVKKGRKSKRQTKVRTIK